MSHRCVPAPLISGHLSTRKPPRFRDSAYHSENSSEITTESVSKYLWSRRSLRSGPMFHNLKDGKKQEHRTRSPTAGRISIAAHLIEDVIKPEYPGKEVSRQQSSILQTETSGSSEPPCSCSHSWLDQPHRQRSTAINSLRDGPLSECRSHQVVPEHTNLVHPRSGLGGMGSGEKAMAQITIAPEPQLDGTIKVRRWLEDGGYSLESRVEGPLSPTDQSIRTMAPDFMAHHDHARFTKDLEELTLCEGYGAALQKIEFPVDADVAEIEIQRTRDASDANSYSSVPFTESFVEHDEFAEEPFSAATRAMQKPWLRYMQQRFLECLSLRQVDVAKEILLSIIAFDNAQTAAAEGGEESTAAGVNSGLYAQASTSQSLSPQNSKRPRQSKKRTEKDKRKDDDDDEYGNSKRLRLHGGLDQPRRLACPFHKRNPGIYNGMTHKNFRTCAGPGWLTVHHMKEHLDRKHKRAVRCDRCLTVFPTREARTEHSRTDPPCLIVPVEFQIEELNEDQQMELRKQSPRSFDERGKWIDLYKRVFKETNDANIPDPYYNEEDSWSRTGSDYARFLQEARRFLDDPAVVEALVNRLQTRRHTQAPQPEILSIPSQDPELSLEEFQEQEHHTHFVNALQGNISTHPAGEAHVHDENSSFAVRADRSTVPTVYSEIFSRSTAGPSFGTLGDMETAQSIHDAEADNGMRPSVLLVDNYPYQTSPDLTLQGQQIHVPQSQENLGYIDPRNSLQMNGDRSRQQMTEDELMGMQKHSHY